MVSISWRSSKTSFFIMKNQSLTIIALVLGLLSAVAYDMSELEASKGGESAGTPIFLVALATRIFTYIMLFYSCRGLVEALGAGLRRTLLLATIWSVLGLSIACFVWWQFGHGSQPFTSPEIKRFAPNTPADFAPGWTLSEVALGKSLAKTYSWVPAIGLEAIAIAVASFAAAFFLAVLAKYRLLGWAYCTPLVSFAVLIAYGLLVPWSFVWDFDIFIGDALVGAMLLNGLLLPMTLLYGGFLAPAVWIGLIAITNLLLMRAWRRADQAKS